MPALNGVPDPQHDGLLRLALAERHAAAGARFAPFAGWDMPLQYEGIVAEHETVRAAVGVFDVSHLGRAWVVGSEAGRAIRSVTTFDVTTIPVGSSHYSLYCNGGGGIEDDIFVYRVEADRWLVAHNAANAEPDYARLAAACGAMSTEVTHETVMLAVQGPTAPALLTSLFGDAYASLEPRGCVEVDWRGTPVLVARTGYTGEDGGECIIAAEYAAALWDVLLATGAKPIGLGARDPLRLEAALPLHGHDLDPTTEPYSAGLGFAVTLEDGASFPGRLPMLHFAADPPPMRLACIKASGRGGVFRAGMPVLDPTAPEGSAPIGHLASGAFSPSLHTSISMAYLPSALTKPGTPLAVDVRGRAEPAEVVRRPFVRGSARRG